MNLISYSSDSDEDDVKDLPVPVLKVEQAHTEQKFKEFKLLDKLPPLLLSNQINLFENLDDRSVNITEVCYQ